MDICMRDDDVIKRAYITSPFSQMVYNQSRPNQDKQKDMYIQTKLEGPLSGRET